MIVSMGTSAAFSFTGLSHFFILGSFAFRLSISIYEVADVWQLVLSLVKSFDLGATTADVL